ncbi:MAG TPA: type II toxin-antitoxin system HicA family toxin [Candidatus Hydrogenedentes bacterium]|nr:type II toxin-antitoxin system HicA family toxin [Candidatus Hydrogenedentota bacterium]
MSPRLPHLTARATVQIVEAEGFRFDRQKGSHAVYLHSDGRRVTIPMHANRTLGPGLLLQILRDADIDPDTLRR